MNNVTRDYNYYFFWIGKFAISPTLLIIWAILSSGYIYAACPSKATATGTVNFGTLTVTSATVGSLIGSQTVTIGSGHILNIHGGFYHNLTKFTTLSNLGNGIYDTNISGIGIKVYVGENSNYLAFPQQDTYAGQGMRQPQTYLVELYKTSSSVQTGSITGGQIATVSCGSPSTSIYNAININTVTIINASCTVDTSSITVPLGNVYSSIFSTVGSTSNETAFTIPLTCPSTGVKVKIQLDGNTVSGSTTALALSNSGDNGVASGYGVQVITGSSPIVIGTPTQVTTSTMGQINVPLKARYIKTSANSSSGTANSTATFTISYE